VHQPDFLDIEVTVLAVTGKALLLENEEGEEEWFPLSQLEDGGEYFTKGETTWISIKAWLLQKKGWR